MGRARTGHEVTCEAPTQYEILDIIQKVTDNRDKYFIEVARIGTNKGPRTQHVYLRRNIIESGSLNEPGLSSKEALKRMINICTCTYTCTCYMTSFGQK